MKYLKIGLGLLFTMASPLAEELKLEIIRSVRVSFSTEIGKQYQILRATYVAPNRWLPLGEPIEGNGEIYTFHRDSEGRDATFFKVEEVGADLGELTIANLGMKMVRIPAGTFVMGSPPDEEGRLVGFEGPQTTVTISRPFWMSKFEVTINQVREYLQNGGSKRGIDFPDPDCPILDNSTFSLRNNKFGRNGNQPMVQIWRIGVEDFCEWLTERERVAGRLPAGHEYKLPTEAQWEYACRAGTTTRFSYGDDPGYTELHKYAWYSSNSGSTTHNVGEKLANPWGLHDMHGNVEEWCLDWYARSYPGDSYSGDEQVDPVGGVDLGFGRVIRSGSWSLDAKLCRSASRNWRFKRHSVTSRLGFRPVLVSVL